MSPHLPGSETAHVDLGGVEVEVAIDAGPRIVAFNRADGPSLFASLLGEVIEHPAIGSYAFIGGHRLWRAPEVAALTYLPDDSPVVVEPFEGGVTVTGPPEPDGVVKIITLRRRGRLTLVDHVLRHEGRRPLACAAWAITQFMPGGVAILPQSRDPVDPDGVQPNRAVILWPYTDPSSPEVEFGPADIRIHATDHPGKTKVGITNRRGWLAYALDGELFVKWSPLHDDRCDYTDLGASAQVFRDPRFLELETLSPLTTLEPGQELHHREVWLSMPLAGRPLDGVVAELEEEYQGDET